MVSLFGAFIIDKCSLISAWGPRILGSFTSESPPILYTSTLLCIFLIHVIIIKYVTYFFLQKKCEHIHCLCPWCCTDSHCELQWHLNVEREFILICSQSGKEKVSISALFLWKKLYYSCTVQCKQLFIVSDINKQCRNDFNEN